MTVLETERLQILEFKKKDAKFVFDLVNEPAWIEFIGDKNVKTLNDASNFIEHKLQLSYKENGFGLFLVQLKELNIPIGMCGLVNRPELDDIDVGFAFLAKHRKKGYAFESSKAMLDYAKNTLKINKIVAITNPNNMASGKLLEKLGFTFDKLIDLSKDGKDMCKLFIQKGT
jgi:RimJ/RimL family protein N-acetyltransferase